MNGVVVPPDPAQPPPGSREVAWRTWPGAARLLATGATYRTSLPVALVVGTLLCAVNQGAALLAGDVDAVTLARVVANYAIPYLVSSVGFLSAHRTRPPSG
jgi:hypothetical protein